MDDWGARDPRWAGLRTEWLDVGGTSVRTLRADGPADGTPQLLVHGLGGSATNWVEVAVALSAHGPVVATDLPGFGRTAPPTAGASTVRRNARFVSALCRTLGWDRIVLHGNSMGGLISTLVAAHRPDLVERLVLVNPALPVPRSRIRDTSLVATARFAPFVSPRLGALVMNKAAGRFTAAEMYDQTIDLCFADPASARPPLRDLGIENVEWGRGQDWRVPGFADAATSLVKMLASGRALNRAIDAVEAPTLLLWGDRDRLVSSAAMDAAVARRPDWTFHVFRDVGHVPMLEVPDAHVAVVSAWLETSAVPHHAGASA